MAESSRDDGIVPAASPLKVSPQVTHAMSADLVWMLTRKQNCFIRQKKGSGGDQLVRPRARANRFAPPRSSMAPGLLRQPLGVSAGAETAVPLSPPLPVADRPLCAGRAVHQRAEQPDAEALVQILRPGKRRACASCPEVELRTPVR